MKHRQFEFSVPGKRASNAIPPIYVPGLAEANGLCPHSTASAYCETINRYLVKDAGYQDMVNQLSDHKLCESCKRRTQFGNMTLAQVWQEMGA